MNYTIIAIYRNGNKVTKKIKGNSFINALENLLEQCEKEDDTGIFFELENANIEELRKDNGFFEVNGNGINVVEYINGKEHVKF